MLSFLVSSCTDDDVTGPGNVPLQVSVTANSPLVSRAIVTDEYLPDGSTIGVSLFAADGSSYDGQNYSNVKFTAAGTGEAQTWTGSSAVSLSGNPATVVAYYPWQEGADLTAIPVETDSQTDYMWAEKLTGVANTNPGVELVMNHALTAVRVKLVLGDYTGDVSVSDISVASPALGTAASLDVLGGEGALDDITGQGDAVALDVDFDMTAEGTSTDVMLVPDESVTSGNTVVTATIGGKKFTAGIPFDEAYKQGYVYTYTITLNNKGFEVTKVAVTPWEDGGLKEAEFVPEKDDAYIVEIDLSEEYQADLNFVHNIYGFIGSINWGDGTTDTYTETTSAPSHIYNEYGKYTITAKGTMNSLNSYSSDVSKFISKLVRIGIDMGVESMSYAFYGQWLKDGFSAGALDGCSNITSFEEAFAKTGITSIPSNLFDECTEVTSFMGVFESNAITSIPEGLFDNNTKVTSFDGAFWGCSWLKTIPEGLFDKCTEVTTFGQTFCNCEQLQAIPEGLFDKNTKVTSFGTTFCNCEQLQAIPEGLFDKCPDANYFAGTFSGCNGLIDVPVGLFDYNIKVTHFSRTFWDCSSWTGESPYSIIQVDGVDTKVHLYERENYPEYFTKPKTGEDCFQACKNLTDFNNIASNWK